MKTVYEAGCSQVHTSAPAFSVITGNGSLGGSSSSHTCSASRGGGNNTSWTFQYLGINVAVPLKFTTGTGGANATFLLNVKGQQAASVNHPNCPASYLLGGFGPAYQCYSEATVEIGAFAYIVDLTNSSMPAYSSQWAGVNSTGGFENLSVLVNTSSGSHIVTTNGSVGAPASISGHYAPRFFLNGTFVSSHKYELIAILWTYQSTGVYGYPSGAKARTSIDLSGPLTHADLRVTTW